MDVTVVWFLLAFTAEPSDIGKGAPAYATSSHADEAACIKAAARRFQVDQGRNFACVRGIQSKAVAEFDEMVRGSKGKR